VSEMTTPLRRSPPIFTRGKAREILHPSWSVDESELVPAGPPAQFSLASGFADTAAWYREAGWI